MAGWLYFGNRRDMSSSHVMGCDDGQCIDDGHCIHIGVAIGVNIFSCGIQMLEIPRNFNIRNPGKPCLIFVFADWCPHCRRMKPIIQEVEKLLGSVVPVYGVDSDKSPDLVKAWDVNGYPTLLFAGTAGGSGSSGVWKYDGQRTPDAISSFVCHQFSSAMQPDQCSAFM